MHCAPTSIAGEYLTARADVRQNGCRAVVKAIARPDATAQAVMITLREPFDSFSRHTGDVAKLLPRGLLNRQAVALQTAMAMIVAQPCRCQPSLDVNAFRFCSYREQHNDCQGQQISSNDSGMNETCRNREYISRAQEQQMLASDDSSMPAHKSALFLLLRRHSSDEFASHDCLGVL